MNRHGVNGHTKRAKRKSLVPPEALLPVEFKPVRPFVKKSADLCERVWCKRRWTKLAVRVGEVTEKWRMYLCDAHCREVAGVYAKQNIQIYWRDEVENNVVAGEESAVHSERGERR